MRTKLAKLVAVAADSIDSVPYRPISYLAVITAHQANAGHTGSPRRLRYGDHRPSFHNIAFHSPTLITAQMCIHVRMEMTFESRMRRLAPFLAISRKYCYCYMVQDLA